MIRTATSKFTALAALLGICAGCGGTVEVGQVDSGLPKDKSVAELTAEEEQVLCKAMFQAANERIADIDQCVVLALDRVAGDLGELEDQRQACTDTYEACMEATDPEHYLHDLDTLTCSTSSNPCQATVAEVEACWTDEVEWEVRPAVADCDTLTDADVDAHLERFSSANFSSSACEALYAKCPDGFHP